MTMMFQTIKSRIVSILGDNAGGLFRVAGYQPQREGATNTKLSSRVVRVFFESGEFPENASSRQGPVKHNMTFGVIMAVSAPAKGDLTTLEDPTSSAAEKAAALAGFQEAADLADEQLDDLAYRVYQIMMDNRYQFMGDGDTLADLQVADRWISRIEKDDPSPRGDLVSLTGSFEFTISAIETIDGASGLSEDVDGGLDLELVIQDEDDNEDTAAAGVATEDFS